MTGNMSNTQNVITGLIGNPVSQSLSAMIHRYWMQHYQIDGEYAAYQVEEAALAGFFAQMRTEKWRGINVTVPHKQAVMGLLDEVDEVASAIGAVNTVVGQNGKLMGYNTDMAGWWKSIMATTPEHTKFLQHVVVIGAGGAARAVVNALYKAKAAHVTIINRTHSAASELAQHYGAHTASWQERDEALAGASMLINTTSLGMRGKEALSLSLDRLPREALVSDIVYAPLKTPLLLAAEKRGNVVVGGLMMLIYQAADAFYLWHGIRPQIDDALIALLTQELLRREGI